MLQCAGYKVVGVGGFECRAQCRCKRVGLCHKVKRWHRLAAEVTKEASAESTLTSFFASSSCRVDGMRQRDLVTYPTWERYVVLSHVVAHMGLRDRRAIIHSVRNNAAYSVPDAFFPNIGLTLAEFAVWYAIGEPRTKLSRRKKDVLAV